MADISTFPSMGIVVRQLGLTFTATANGAITAGMVVSFDDAGISNDVMPCVAEAGTWPIGVAITSAVDNAEVTVASYGSIVKVANADDTTGIDAGDFLAMNDCAAKGTVAAADLTASGATVLLQYVVGIALEDIAGGGTGFALIAPQQIVRGNAS